MPERRDDENDIPDRSEKSTIIERTAFRALARRRGGGAEKQEERGEASLYFCAPYNSVFSRT